MILLRVRLESSRERNRFQRMPGRPPQTGAMSERPGGGKSVSTCVKVVRMTLSRGCRVPHRMQGSLYLAGRSAVHGAVRGGKRHKEVRTRLLRRSWPEKGRSKPAWATRARHFREGR